MFSVCEFCKSELAVLYCRADSASLCLFCDRHVHSANALSLNHTRFWICPASKKNGLFLCPDCDCSISSTTPVQGCPSATSMASLIVDQGQRKRNTEVCQQLAEMARRDSLWFGLDFPELSPPMWYEEDDELLKQHGDEEDDLLWDYNPTYDSSLIWEFRLDCEESGSTINESRLLVIPKQEISAAFEDNLSNQPMLIRPETEKELAKSEHVVPTRNESPKSKEDIEIMAQKRGNAMLRYMEKKKIRRYDKHIRYESRKARADARTRVKGRFVKSTQALNNQV